MKSEYVKITILANKTISEALKQMDLIKRKLLIIVNEDSSFFSLLSIGDIQRAIIANKPLDTLINQIIREDVRVAYVGDDLEAVKNRMRIKRNEFMPIINELREIIDVIFWEDLFENETRQKQKSLNIPVVIMAGGKGNRLKPLTNVLPKPLIPINNKTIIEDIMDRFLLSGCNDFFISVNYKAEMIRYYLNSLENKSYNIKYFQEDKPLGTAGSLSLLKGKITKTFFVSNCDILIDQDYSEILKYHRENNNEITIISALKHFPIPYGTIKSGENGQLIELIEKPELTFKINSGMYILEPNLLNLIPENKFLHITDLIQSVKERDGKIGVFPVSEKSWKDFGSLSEYKFGVK